MVKVYKVNSQSVYTIFYLESRSSEILYLIDCVAMGLNRLGYRIVAEQCVWLYIYWYDFQVNNIIGYYWCHFQCDILYVKIIWYSVSIIFPTYYSHYLYIESFTHVIYLIWIITLYMCKISENVENAGICVFRTTVRLRNKCPLDSTGSVYSDACGISIFISIVQFQWNP